MSKIQIYFIFSIIILAGCFLAYYYIFNIYEVTYTVSPSKLISGKKQTAVITAVPLNAFGKKAPFRKAETSFKITAGQELVKIISENYNEGIFVIESKGSAGKLEVQAKSKYSMLPSTLEIYIYRNNNDLEDNS